jgi:hypothetical protein
MTATPARTTLVFAGLLCALAGCSTVREANRPDPVKLAQFHAGDHRLDVLGKIGAPMVAAQKDEQNSCDIYRMYTHGASGLRKGAVVAGKAVADLATLGLFEVVATPAEANMLHTVSFCYSKDNRLVSLSDAGKELLIPPATPTRKILPATSTNKP